MKYTVIQGLRANCLLAGAGLDTIAPIVHRNPKNTQQVRATYRQEALTVCPLPVLNRHVREFLSKLGLTITKETLSRVDMQVTIDIPVLDIVCLIFKKHFIKKARKSAIYLWGDVPETYRTGDIDNIQVCIYDKRRQMNRTMQWGSPKHQLTVEHTIGLDWWLSNHPITRVEFRLGRTALKNLGVNSVEDLIKRERGIFDLITRDWFRLLKGEKIRGKENRQEMHPIWEHVRSLGFEHFTGNEIPDVEYRRSASVSCDPVALEKQAAGCLAKAFSYRHGKPAFSAQVIDYVKSFAGKERKSMYEKAKEDSVNHYNRTGVLLGIGNNGNSPAATGRQEFYDVQGKTAGEKFKQFLEDTKEIHLRGSG